MLVVNSQESYLNFNPSPVLFGARIKSVSWIVYEWQRPFRHTECQQENYRWYQLRSIVLRISTEPAGDKKAKLETHQV